MTRIGIHLGLVAVMLLSGSAAAQQAVPAARATRIITSPSGAMQLQEVPIQLQEMVNALESSAAMPMAVADDSADTLVQQIMSLPITRRASDVVRGQLLGPAQLDDPLPAGMPVPVTSQTPPRLKIPSPEAYQAAQAVAKSKRIQRRAAKFRRDVTLGNWSSIGELLQSLPESPATQIYDHLLMSLTQPIPPTPPSQSELLSGRVVQRNEQPESNYVSMDDVLAIADLAPAKLNEMQLQQISMLLNQSREHGFSSSRFVERLRSGTRWLGGEKPEHRILAVELLSNMGMYREASQLLPAFDELDRTNAKLLLTFGELAQKRFAQDRTQQFLDQAWQCFAAVIELPAADRTSKSTALENLILLSNKLSGDAGEAWIESGLAEGSSRTSRILAVLGSKSLTGPLDSPYSPDQRLEWLRLQNQVVEQLVREAEQPLDRLGEALTLMATAWLREAEICLNQTRTSLGNSYMQVDMYGNYYWVDPNEDYRQAQMGTARPIQAFELIPCCPSQPWIDQVSTDLQLAFPKMMIRLHLAADQEELAFPFIEQIAQIQPDDTQALVDEFLQAWTRNHDPNSNRRMQNRYIYMYGFEQRADSIPLTRSKQERNIQDLSQWVQRIRQLPIDELDETQLAKAFTTCHSSAEVFKLSAMESVFGSIEQLKPETIAELAGTMRSNLATVWRSIRQQEEMQTNRKEPQIQQEVIRGYETARIVLERALEKHPDHWRLLLALASIEHDENDYNQSVQKSSEYSARREAILARYADAAKLYSQTVIGLEESKQTTDAFDYWFYASLGAVDLGRITADTVPAQRQFPLIRQAIEALPAELAEDHMAKFANNLFTRMSPLKPELKYRYLKAGFEIVGDHPRAAEARSLFQYYNDLVTEIQLLAEIDGSDVVGHQRPFGVYFSIQHTAEIERESAGFAKYAQNQNAMMYAYNYGRPTEDYRDKFEKNLTEALSEHFEVLSIAFEDPKNMHSRESDPPGWRVTPYAYAVLRPLGPQVDKLPAVQLDLDFLDTSGYVVIPVHSAILPLDASLANVPPRPYSDLEITQTLDERQAFDGKLIVEIKATARGLVPELDDVLDLQFPGFEIASIDQQPVMPSGFDPKSEEIVINSDRSWTIELQPAVNSGQQSQFRFAAAKIPDIANNFQRYENSDLIASEQQIDLDQSYARSTVPVWLWSLIPLGVAALLFVVWRVTRPAATVENSVSWEMPSEINPFTVLSLLKRIRQAQNGDQRFAPELDRSIAELEQYYFGPTNGQPTPDLQAIARTWTTKVHQH